MSAAKPLQGEDRSTEVDWGTPARAPEPPQAPAPRLVPRAGQTLGRYVLQELLGNGSTSLIFRSFHEALGVPVALKVFRPIDAVVDPGARERFVREARVLARLDHPNIVRVLDVDETQGVPFIVFEFVGAMSLDELVRAIGCLSNARALELAHDLASALRAAHRQGLIHRDVKPANVLVRKDGVVKLVDFGLAQSPAELANATDELISGTPSFMAPEAIVSPTAVDEGADMYSLGCTLFYALTGRAPFERSNPAQTMRAQVEDPPPPVSGLRVDVHPGLEAVVMRLLAKERGDRYATWDELIAVLDELGHERAVAKPPGGRRAAESSLSTVSATVSHLFRKGAR